MAALFAAALLLDWSLLSKAYVFEGLARALPIDTGRWRELTPGHYVGYGPVGWVFHHLLQALGRDQPAVVSLQLLDGLCGAGGVALQFSSLRRLGASRAAAAAWSMVLAGAYAWWLWSTDAQAYVFSGLLLAAVFRLVVERLAGGKISPKLLGAAHGLALAGHLVNGLFALPIAVALWRTTPRNARGRAFLEYAAAFAATGAALYALALGLFVRPETAERAWRWLQGSAAVGATEDAVAWHGSLSLASAGTWLSTTLGVLTTVTTARWIVLGAAFASFMRLRKSSGLARDAALVCLSWIGAYALVFTSWEPQTLVYRVPEAVPLTILLYLGLRSTGAGAALAAILLAANGAAELVPRSKAENNAALQRMAFIQAHTTPMDFVTGDGGTDELYVPYFAHRPPLVLGQYAGRPEKLEERMKAILARGGGVVITSRALADETWGPFFAKRKLTPIAKREDGFALYRLSARP